MIAVSSVDRPPLRPRTRLTSAEYTRLRRLVQRHAGLRLSEHKQREVEVKLARCSAGDRSGAALLSDLARSEERLQEVVEELTVGESYFYRNRPHFEALRTRVIPALLAGARRRKTLAFWSAACATGEEPYSLAMLLAEHFPLGRQWSVSIRGSDVNRRFLTLARRARYPSWSLRGLDPDQVSRHFLPLADDRYQLRPSMTRQVTLAMHNLTTDTDPPGTPPAGFDLILCRNVLIYFDRQAAEAVLGRLVSALRPGGYLFVGHADSYPALGALEAVYECGTFYYRKPSRARRSPSRISSLIPGLAVQSNAAPRPDNSHVRNQGKAPEPSAGATPLGTVALHDEADLEAKLERARELANRSQLADALAELQRLAEGEGRLDHRVHFLCALVADQAGLLTEPRQSLRQALFLKRDFVVAHYFLGVLAERSGDWSTVQRCFRNVGELLKTQSAQEELEETGGLTASHLQEIVQQRLGSVRLEKLGSRT